MQVECSRLPPKLALFPVLVEQISFELVFSIVYSKRAELFLIIPKSF